MPAHFIKSSESLEHDQLGEGESWRSGSARKSLTLSGGGGQGSWVRAGKEGGAVFGRPGPSHAREPEGVQGRGAWTQGCPGPGCSVQPGQQGPGHGVARKALELHPGQLPMHRGPQGGGKAGGTTGRYTPKLSTKNGRFGLRECRSSGGQMGRPAGSPGDGRGPSMVLYELRAPQDSLFAKGAPPLKQFENP